MQTQSISEEDALIKQSTEEAYGADKDESPKSRRSWNPQLIPQYQLPDYLKYDPVLFQFFRRLHYQDKNFICLVVGDPGCQPAGSKVLMADGSWKSVENIAPGDRVISPNINGSTKIGNVKTIHRYYSTNIFSVYEKRTNRKLYSCAGNHFVPYKYTKHTTKYDALEAKKLFSNISPRMTTKVGVFIKSFDYKKRLLLDPYFLGVWLGDGYSGNTNGKSYYVRITSADPDIIQAIEKIYGPMDSRPTQSLITNQYYYRKRNHLGIKLEKLGLHDKNCYNKSIPIQYKLSSYKNRLKILAGLIDTDGTVDKIGRITFGSVSNQLAEDVIFIVNSLGGRATKTIATKTLTNKSISYLVHINLGKYTKLLPLQCKRKEIRLKNTSHDKDPTDLNFIIKKENGAQTFGFEVDSPSHQYITDNFAVCRNSGKSCSAISLARALDITPLGNGKFKRNFIIKSDSDGKGTPETRVVFGPSQFMQLIKSGLPKGSIIIWDEAGIGNDATSWNDKKSRLIKHVMQTFRSRNYGIFMTVPDKESITLSTRRLVHCYIDVARRDETHAYLDIRWLSRVRGTEKTQTYYKYPVFRDPISGKLKKIVKYKIPRVDPIIEKEYNKIKDNTLQDIYDYYQREMEFMEKELGEKSGATGAGTAIKLKKFNMATATNIAKTELKNITNDDTSFSAAKVMLVLAQKGLECNNTQAKLVVEVLKNDRSVEIV